MPRGDDGVREEWVAMYNDGMAMREIAEATGATLAAVEYALVGAPGRRAAGGRTSEHQPIVMVTAFIETGTMEAIRAMGPAGEVARHLLERAMERIDPDTVELHPPVPAGRRVKFHVRVSRPLRACLREAAGGRQLGRFVAAILRDEVRFDMPAAPPVAPPSPGVI